MMAGIKSLIQQPKWRTLLFVLFVLLFYITRLRPADPIEDLQLIGDIGYLAAGKSGVILLNFADPDHPVSVSEYDTLGYANAVVVRDDRVYVADGSNGLEILSRGKLQQGDPTNIRLANFNPRGRVIDVALWGNHAYLIDSNGDIWIININFLPIDPNLAVKKELPSKATGINIFGNRVYVTDNKDQLYIFPLENPTLLENPAIFNAGAPIHNVDVVGERAYLAASSRGLIVINQSSFPELILETESGEVRDAVDVSLWGTSAYVASGKRGFFVLDVSNRSTATVMGHSQSLKNATLIRANGEDIYVADGTDGLKNFSSSYWFEFAEIRRTNTLGSYERVLVKDNFAYAAAGDAGLQVIDVGDPTSPGSNFFADQTNGYATSIDSRGEDIYVLYRNKGLKVFTIAGTPGFPSPADIEKDTPGEANDLFVRGDLVFIADGSEGLQIINLQNIAVPEIYGKDTPGNALGVYVLDAYAYLADGGEGLQIFQISNPQDPVLVQNIETYGEARSVFVQKIQISENEERTYAFVADGSNGVVILDVTDPFSPVSVSGIDVKNYANDVLVMGEIAYVTERDDGLILLDISNISEPSVISNQTTPGDARGLSVRENFAYIADGNRGLRVVDIHSLENMREVGFFDLPSRAAAIDDQFAYGYMLDGADGMWIMDISNPKNPDPMSFYTTPGRAKSQSVNGAYVYIADGSAGLHIVNASIPFAPTRAGVYEHITDAEVVANDGGYTYVGSRDYRLHILNTTDPVNIEQVGIFPTRGIPKDIGVFAGYVYIAEGESGMEIINVKEPNLPISTILTRDLGLMDTQDVLVMGYRQHLFVADGRNGMKVFDIRNPANPVQVYHFELHNGNGIARSLAFEGEYAFLTVENEAIYQFNIFELENITVVGSTPIQQAQSITATSASVNPGERYKRLYTYVAGGDNGLIIYEVNGTLMIGTYGFYETHGEASIPQIFQSILFRLLTQFSENPIPIPQKVWARIGYITYGLLVFGILAAVWLSLFAQFVLPVQTFKEGSKALSRLYDSLWGNHGPAVFAKDGDLVAKPGELERRGRGVARVDLNSAIVLERRSFYQSKWRKYYQKLTKREKRKGSGIPEARVEGPGVVFIQPYETIRGVADLRTQFRIRPGVKAYTRDGIEVNNPVWILFTLGQAPEVLDVAYDGPRVEKNLRVVIWEDSQITTGNGIRKRAITIKKLSDELDKEDRREIHLYVQKQVVNSYYLRVRTLATSMEISGDPHEILDRFIGNIHHLAEKLKIETREEVRDFLTYSKDLASAANNNELFDQAVIQMYIYHLVIYIDQLTLGRMENFHSTIQRAAVEQYRQEIKGMDELHVQVDYAKREMVKFDQHFDPEADLNAFCLLALRTQESIEAKILGDLRQYRDDDYSKTPVAELNSFLEKFSYLTGELIRVDYPQTAYYSVVATLNRQISLISLQISEINIQVKWRVTNAWKVLKIRDLVQSLKKRIADIENNCKDEMDRYPDYVKIHDFVVFVENSVKVIQSQELIKSNQDQINECAVQIKWRGEELSRLTDSVYHRPIGRIQKITASLKSKGMSASDLYFFAQTVSDIWYKLETADLVAVRSFFRKSRPKIKEIRGDINKLDAMIGSNSLGGLEIEYKERVAAIRSYLAGCTIPGSLMFTREERQVRVGPFLFDRKRVLAAVYSDALDINRVAGEDKHMHWTKLPVHVAAQIFRDLVSREQYDYLYQPKATSTYNMPKLKANLSRAVRNQGVLAFRFVDHMDGEAFQLGKTMDPDELQYYDKRDLKTPKVLRARGIKVIGSGFPDLFPVGAGVSESQLDYWRAPWQRDAIDNRSRHQLQAVRIINHERAESQREMAYNLARILRSSQTEEALAIRVFQALEATASDDRVRQFLPRESILLLRSFSEWYTADSSTKADDEEIRLEPLEFSDADQIPGSSDPFDEETESEDQEQT